jgi:translation initiation factor 2B subunit (eIF-2B alpha/beta/delta family)/8-oxo-dGTP pyrophosphatase MutT (NUDIX family)
MTGRKQESSREPPGNVVTAFLCAGTKILLLHRSSRVGIHRHLWAGVSGRLEQGDRTPLDRARIEIQEETGIEDPRLLSAGAPVDLVVGSGKHVRVHPFLFEIEDPEAVRLDWEHDDARWIDPEELGNFETVPLLVDTLDRVLPVPELPGWVRLTLARLRGDRDGGAREVTRRALGMVARAAESGAETSTVLRLLDEVAILRPAMAPLGNAARDLRAEIEALRDRALPRTVASLASAARTSLDVGLGRLVARGSERIAGARVVVVTSWSSTVVACLTSGSYRGEVRVLESRPPGEGGRTARALERAGIRSELYPDSAAGHAVRGADLVVLGADALLSGGSIVNKTGSLPLSLSAREHGVEVIVVADALKKMRDGIPESLLEERVQAEPLGEGPTPRAIPLFEIVPAHLVSEILTDE